MNKRKRPESCTRNETLHYTAEQKVEAVKTALSKSLRKAAEQSGASRMSVRIWIKQAAIYGLDVFALTQEEKNRLLRNAKRNDPKQRYFHTQDEVSEYLGMTQVTVNKLVKNGEIKGERVGFGRDRSHRIYPVAEVDRYHLERIKKKLGENFEDEMVEVDFVIDAFQSLNVDLREFKTIVSDIKKATYPDDKRETVKLALVLYRRFHRDVQRWIYNRLKQRREKNNAQS